MIRKIYCKRNSIINYILFWFHICFSSRRSLKVKKVLEVRASHQSINQSGLSQVKDINPYTISVCVSQRECKYTIDIMFLCPKHCKLFLSTKGMNHLPLPVLTTAD